MKDLIITINADNRKVKLNRDFVGLNGENLQGNIVVDFTDKADFIDGTASLEVEQNGEKYSIAMTKDTTNKIYTLPIKTSLLRYACTMKCQVTIAQAETADGIPVFKCEVFNLPCYEAINAVGSIPEQYPSTTLLEALEYDGYAFFEGATGYGYDEKVFNISNSKYILTVFPFTARATLPTNYYVINVTGYKPDGTTKVLSEISLGDYDSTTKEISIDNTDGTYTTVALRVRVLAGNSAIARLKEDSSEALNAKIEAVESNVATIENDINDVKSNIQIVKSDLETNTTALEYDGYAFLAGTVGNYDTTVKTFYIAEGKYTLTLYPFTAKTNIASGSFVAKVWVYRNDGTAKEFLYIKWEDYDNTIKETTIDNSESEYERIEITIRAVNGTMAIAKLEKQIETPEIPEITVDSELSDTSTNPVENKVVKAEFDRLNGEITDKATAIETNTKGIEKTTTALENDGFAFLAGTAGNYASSEKEFNLSSGKYTLTLYPFEAKTNILAGYWVVKATVYTSDGTEKYLSPTPISWENYDKTTQVISIDNSDGTYVTAKITIRGIEGETAIAKLEKVSEEAKDEIIDFNITAINPYWSKRREGEMKTTAPADMIESGIFVKFDSLIISYGDKVITKTWDNAKTEIGESVFTTASDLTKDCMALMQYSYGYQTLYYNIDENKLQILLSKDTPTFKNVVLAHAKDGWGHGTICEQYNTVLLANRNKYLDEVNEAYIEDIKSNELKLLDMKDNFSILMCSDVHYTPDIKSPDINVTNAIIKEIDKDFYFDAILNCGDDMLYGTKFKERGFVALSKMFDHIDNDRFIYAVGNHDFNSVADGTTVNTSDWIITDTELSSLTHRRIKATNRPSGKLYYYRDYPEKKVRVIVLNTMDVPIEFNADKTIKYDPVRVHGIRQAQFDWLINNALVVESEWKIVVCMHVGLYTPDEGFAGNGDTLNNKIGLRNIFSAFNSKGTYNFSNTSDDYDGIFKVALNGTMAGANGKIVAVLSGHGHNDAHVNIDGFNAIQIDCSYPHDGERQPRTISEFSVDAIVFDDEAEKIKITRFGLGNDREYNY